MALTKLGLTIVPVIKVTTYLTPLKTTIVAKYQNNDQLPYQWLNNPIVVKATKVLKYYKKMLLSMVFSNKPLLNFELWLNYGWTFENVR